MALQSSQRRVLIIVLIINAVMFIAEFGAGVVAGSTALMADAADMLGDAFAYGAALFALSRGARWKARAAVLKGVLILILGLGILLGVALKLKSGVRPSSTLMLVFGSFALLANVTCLSLLWNFRTQDINMSSTFECSRNDVISNCGVLLAAGAVALFHSPWPDLIIGTIIALIILRSAYRVLKEAILELRN